VRLYGECQNLRISTTIIPTIQKETAPANPTHSGIYFSPSFDPFLLISKPKIRFLCINSATLGMRMVVSIHAPIAVIAIKRAIVSGNCERAVSDEKIMRRTAIW